MGSGTKQLVASLLGAVGGGQRGAKKEGTQPQTVELRVRMDCERQVKKALAGMRGVERVEVNRKQQRVTVTGTVDPHKVLRRAQSTAKKAELWPRNHHHPSFFFETIIILATTTTAPPSRPTTAPLERPRPVTGGPRHPTAGTRTQPAPSRSPASSATRTFFLRFFFCALAR
ncbi:heavy metal-associated isoprenylated plant protein 23-like [Triticum urartu]|uniref:heavy metal-associated isoprenylated plant protein 23-like n=1 Tax=Triticum urartu TaxID=4572 RepID=UPI00204453DE|nr:heavy metal-associated isoprenylated plant protein 23-like [Triticum urartu]